MPDPEDYRQYAGTILFPRTPSDLTSTSICPACFTPLTSTTCTNCRLDVSHPLGANLADASADAAASLARRVELIGQMRYESSLARVVAPDSTPVPVAAEPSRASAAAPPPAPVAPPQPPREPRRSSVQVILLIVGVSLLSIAAVFFLVYAFINFGIVWRSVIIAAITVAAFAVASILRRRGLAATAEGIGVFAVVLVYLDAFAVRANDLFGANASEPLLYWGSTLLISSVVFYAWHRISSLRVASVAAFGAVVPGAFLLVAGLALDVDALTKVFIGFAAAATIGLVFPLAAQFAERTVVLSLASLAWVLAFCFAFAVEPEQTWAPAIALGVLAVVAAAYAIVPGAALWRRGFAVAGGVAAAASAGAGLFRDGQFAVLVIVPAVVAALIALSLETAGRRVRQPMLIASAAGAGLVAALLLVPAAVTSGMTVIDAFLGGAWTIGPLDPVEYSDVNDYNAVLALAIVVVLVGVASVLAKVRRTGILAWSIAALLVLAAPLLGVLVAVLGAWLLIAAAGVIALIVQSRFRLPITATAIAAAALGYGVAWRSESTWLVASAVTVALFLVARRLIAAKAVLLGVAIAVAMVAAAALPEQIASGGVDSLRLVGAVGVVVLLAPLRGADRRVAFWMGLPVVAATAVAARLSTTESAPASQFVIALVLGIALLAALAVVVVRGSGFALERIVSSVALSPALLWVLDSLVHVIGVPVDALATVPLAAALLVSATGLLGPLRAWRDAGVGLIAIPALLYTVASPSELTWLVLLFAALTALLVAISRDGLFGSSSARKHLGWLALLLGVSSLWWRLATLEVQPVEPYVLPVAAVLAALAIFMVRASLNAAGVVLAALLVAVLPIAVAASTGSVIRAVIIAALSIVLLVGGSFTRGRYSDAAAIAGAVGLVVVSAGRAAFASAPDAPAIDFWLLTALLPLAVAAWGQRRLRGDDTDRIRAIASQVAVIGAMLLVLVFELGVLNDPTFGPVRAVALVLLFAAIHSVSRLADEPSIAWTAIAFAAVTVIGGLIRDTLDPLEFGTIPIAVALLGGAVRNKRGSWATAAPALLVLLIPSLIATVGDRPIWRLVGIGVAAIAVIVFGAVRRQQAPFVIGTVVVLVHAVASFVPQIRAAYLALPWWLWAGFGGVLLIALAARYEHRIKNLKDAVGRLSAMR